MRRRRLEGSGCFLGSFGWALLCPRFGLGPSPRCRLRITTSGPGGGSLCETLGSGQLGCFLLGCHDLRPERGGDDSRGRVSRFQSVCHWSADNSGIAAGDPCDMPGPSVVGQSRPPFMWLSPAWRVLGSSQASRPASTRGPHSPLTTSEWVHHWPVWALCSRHRIAKAARTT